MRRTGRAAAAILRCLSVLVDCAAQGAVILGGCAIALMMLHVTLDIVLRAVFNIVLPGTLTIVTHYYMPVAVFAPLALAERQNAHVSVDVLFARFGPRIQRHLAGLVCITAAAVVILLASRGGMEALRSAQLGTVQIQGNMTIPVWPAYLIVPIGAGLMAAVLVGRLATYLKALAEPPPPDQGAT